MLNSTHHRPITDRTAHNHYRLLRAWKVLADSPGGEERYRWILADNGRCRRTLLTELGRVPDPLRIRWLADQICAAVVMHPDIPTWQTVAHVRDFRLGRLRT